MFRPLLSILMAYLLASAPAYAEILSARDQVTGLTSAMRLTDYSPSTDEKDLAQLNSTVSQFVGNSANAKPLATREGAELKQLHNKLNNYMRIRKVLTECPTKPDKLNHLGGRIMNAAGSTPIESMDSCEGHHDLDDKVQ